MSSSNRPGRVPRVTGVLRRAARLLERLSFRGTAAPIWEGVYSRFEDVPVKGQGFDDDAWRLTLSSELAAVRGGRWYDEFAQDHEALVLACRLVDSPSLRIVDFGGGFGASWFYLRGALPERVVEYQVVERADVAAAARTHAAEEGLSFASSIASHHLGADVVFVKSALQYVPDYATTVASLLALGAEYVLFEKFAGVNCKTYATAQVNHAGSSIAFWFVSVEELTRMAAGAGYRCILRRKLTHSYSQAAFPPEMRMGEAMTLLFRRSGD